MLCEGGDGDIGDIAAAIESGLPGRGGISRGRGDAAMTWQKDVNKGDAAFKEKVLPPAGVASLKKSRLAGISVGDPTAPKPSGGSTGGRICNRPKPAAARPTHRRSCRNTKERLERYFSREKK